MSSILVVGGGAREHALAWACSRSPGVERVLCAPGNGGTAAIAENVPLAADDVAALVGLARDRDIDLVVIGPDAAVAAGLADECLVNGLTVFGPTRAAARVESSKLFAKALMTEVGIPTARWVGGDATSRSRLVAFASDLGGGCVVKADGLALGKGVTVCADVEQARAAIDACLVEGRFGDAGRRVIVEERLEGRELSVMALTDGENVRLLPPACDYKRAGEGDTGGMTGGMGAFAPPSWPDLDAVLSITVDSVVAPCVEALRARGAPYRGCLYAGLMLTDEGVHVLEFNARLGDPEAQVILPLLGADTAGLLAACANGELQPGREPGLEGAAVGVVAAAAGYPGPVTGGARIEGLDRLDGSVLCFHGGTRRDPDGTLRTAGGRVLTVAATGDRVDTARRAVYQNLDRIHFEGAWWRRDIAVVDQNAAVVS